MYAKRHGDALLHTEGERYRVGVDGVVHTVSVDNVNHVNWDAGFCPGDGQPCHRFVTIIDEFGSLFDSQEELDCFRSIVAYANNEAGAADGVHGRTENWFYW